MIPPTAAMPARGEVRKSVCNNCPVDSREHHACPSASHSWLAPAAQDARHGGAPPRQSGRVSARQGIPVLQPSGFVIEGEPRPGDLRANALRDYERGQFANAAAACRRLLAAQPEDVPSLYLLGLAEHRQGEDRQAILHLEQAARLQPDLPEVQAALGCAYTRTGALDNALECFERALRLDPGSADTHYSLGNLHHRRGDLDLAASHFQAAVRWAPEDPVCWHNLGKTLRDLNRLDEAIAAYDRALALAPSANPTRYARAVALLAAGRWTEGFAGYEARPLRPCPGAAPVPRWKGEALLGKTLLVYDEQGFGDAIMAVRFLSLVQPRPARVILECRPELWRLFARSRCADEVVACGQPLPSFDVCLPLFSLPGLWGARPDSVPASVPYLLAPTVEKPASTARDRMRVGVVWAGNVIHDRDKDRTLPLEALATILATPGVAWHCLRPSISPGELAFLRGLPEPVELAPEGSDFLDTAARVENLDLVITVDHRDRPPRGRPSQTRLGAAAPRGGLALAQRPRGLGVVSHHASIPPAGSRRLGVDNAPRGGGTGSGGPAAVGRSRALNRPWARRAGPTPIGMASSLELWQTRARYVVESQGQRGTDPPALRCAGGLCSSRWAWICCPTNGTFTSRCPNRDAFEGTISIGAPRSG